MFPIVPLFLGQAAQVVKLTPVLSGGGHTIGYYSPQRMTLSETKPASVKVEPSGLTHPLYGELSIAGKTFGVILDQPASGPLKFYIDTNDDGDLTNDGEAAWTGKKFGESPYTTFMGTGKVEIPIAGSSQKVSLGIYKFDASDPQRASFKNILFYYRDYAVKGAANLGGKNYPIVLSDEPASGTFDKSKVTLLIDRDGDGKFSGPPETYAAGKPFNIGGTTYEVGEIAPDGSTISFVRSATKVDEIAVAPSLAVGRSAIPFSAKTTLGKSVNFPSSYKGKVVMLDFWATWCGPCKAELPNVKKAYAKYHPKGFEILSISLDDKDFAQKLASFTKENNMPWSQVYDGKFWKAKVATLYGVEAIPFVLLVDGDTGKILADESTLRGPQIETTIAKALQSRGRAAR